MGRLGRGWDDHQLDIGRKQYTWSKITLGHNFCCDNFYDQQYHHIDCDDQTLRGFHSQGCTGVPCWLQSPDHHYYDDDHYNDHHDDDDDENDDDDDDNDDDDGADKDHDDGDLFNRPRDEGGASVRSLV